MAVSQKRSKRKVTGKPYRNARKKRLSDLGSDPTLTKIGENKRNVKRIKGGHLKYFLLSTDTCNLYDPKYKKFFKAKIESVLENQANPNFVRRNILTKGVVVKTNKGKAKITSSPGREGILNAILVE